MKVRIEVDTELPSYMAKIEVDGVPQTKIENCWLILNNTNKPVFCINLPKELILILLEGIDKIIKKTIVDEL